MEKLISSAPLSPAGNPEGYTWNSIDPFCFELPCWAKSGQEGTPYCFVDSRDVVYLYFWETKAYFLQVHPDEVSRITDPQTVRRLSSELRNIQQSNHIIGDREHLLFSCPRGHQWASMRFIDSFHPQSPNCPVCGLTWCNVVDDLPSSK